MTVKFPKRLIGDYKGFNEMGLYQVPLKDDKHAQEIVDYLCNVTEKLPPEVIFSNRQTKRMCGRYHWNALINDEIVLHKSGECVGVLIHELAHCETSGHKKNFKKFQKRLAEEYMEVSETFGNVSWKINDQIIKIKVDIPRKGWYNYIWEDGIIVLCQRDKKTYELGCYGDKSWTCSCPGFAYRRHCSHIMNIPDEIREKVEKVDPYKNSDNVGDGPCVEAAKNAFVNKWNPETEKMEPVLDKDGNRVSAFDQYWS